MFDLGKKNVIGILIDSIDYEAATDKIITAAKDSKSFAVTALAVHGVMTGRSDLQHKYRLNHFDLVCPDGQPVRWALNLLHKTGLPDRCYGPNLTLWVCKAAAAEGLPIYLYGSSAEVLENLEKNLVAKFPGLVVAGKAPSKFRNTSDEEKRQIAQEIIDSGAKILLVGLGCPRQEVFVYEYGELVPMPMLAVGAAFDFHAGNKSQPPAWVQKAGLEWLSRLIHEPRRLFKRYATTNSAYVFWLGLQAIRVWKPDPKQAEKPLQSINYG